MTTLSTKTLRVCALAIALAAPALTQQSSSPPGDLQPTIQALMDRLTAAEARIKELEAKQTPVPAQAARPTPLAAASAPAPTPVATAPVPTMALVPPSDADAALAAALAATQTANPDDAMGHMMEIPGGPTLKIRGFFDFNYGVGSIANPLIYPVADNACGTCGNPATPAHNAFQAGEFDLFITSKLSEHLSFLSEIVLGPDDTNVFGPDIERYELKYKANSYFSAVAGRFHTSIGYYNTAYHHGNWFSTAEGRPIMYLFEDSGGILPVHMVGASFQGEVPHTETLGLHWVAEIGNGNSSNTPVPGGNAVQNFYSDRNYKATNVAAYIRPKFIPGIQLGGSWYHDGLNPSQALNPLPLAEIRQNIESAYVVYFNAKWEFMNEAVMLSNRLAGTSQAFRSPMAYTQVARKFGRYEPYFRYQYVHDNVNDPVNLLTGLYYGPSVGMRIDVFDYAALKLQYNHLYQSGQLPGNGLNAQLAFTF
jgi:hypothetical protein